MIDRISDQLLRYKYNSHTKQKGKQNKSNSLVLFD